MTGGVNLSKRITINEIAKLAGVSKATVSYYLNGNYAKMSLTTKEKIKTIVEEFDYMPNKAATSLATNNTQTLGVVISDITNPFISSVIKGIHDACTLFCYSMTFTNSNNNLEIEQENIKRLYQQNVSGIILDSISPTQNHLQYLNPNTTVLVDKQETKATFDTVVSDNSTSTKAFLKLMSDAGYTDIYFVTYPLKGISTRSKRYQAFKETITDNPDNLLIINEMTANDFQKLFSKKHSKPAFFTMNGPVLLDLMKILNHLNVHYPSDFGIGSYENLDWMEVLNPPISCIAQDSYRIGYTAAAHLVKKIEENQNNNEAKIIEIENSIILRDSF